LAASLHPFAWAEDQILFDDPRYRSIFEELQLVGRRFIAQGLHLHLGLPDPASAIRCYQALLPYLPLFLALSTSSPFYQGILTGFHSYRTKLFEVLPLAGLPRSFSSWEEYEDLLKLLKELEIIQSVRDLWWDIRIQPALGTVEIRICDIHGRFRDLLGLIALIQLLAVSLSERPTPSLHREVLLYGKWQAARHGLDGFMVDPLRKQKICFREVLSFILKEIRPLARKMGLIPYLFFLKELLEYGPTSYRMLALFEAGAKLTEIIEHLRREFWR
jgi:carboxylate-amine ligase